MAEDSDRNADKHEERSSDQFNNRSGSYFASQMPELKSLLKDSLKDSSAGSPYIENIRIIKEFWLQKCKQKIQCLLISTGLSMEIWVLNK